MRITADSHPLLKAEAFISVFGCPLGQIENLGGIRKFFSGDAESPFPESSSLKGDIRDLLRDGGFRPSGRSKPASEYLHKAVEKGWFSPVKGINAAVDICNVVSLHSGLPVSVLDLGLCSEPLRIGVCPPDTRYAFNPSGQVLDASGLLALHDAEGPCGSPVKDSQRTKTSDETVRTLTIVWGHTAHAARVQEAREWYGELIASIGARIVPVDLDTADSPTG